MKHVRHVLTTMKRVHQTAKTRRNYKTGEKSHSWVPSREYSRVKWIRFSADYLAINCDACEITDTKYPCSNFLTKSITRDVPRPNCNIPSYSCPKCFSCSAFILKCSQLTINDTIQTIHDANKWTVDPNVSKSEYNEVSFRLIISVI